MIEQNVGTWDAYMRIMLGLTALACGIRRSSRDSMISNLLIVSGSMKIAEGITRVCPLMYAMGIRTTERSINTTVSQRQDSSSPQPTNDQSQQGEVSS